MNSPVTRTSLVCVIKRTVALTTFLLCMSVNANAEILASLQAGDGGTTLKGVLKDGTIILGISASGLRGISASGLRGISASGLRGISASGLRGISASGLRGISAS